jgi:hypothetical protein
VHPWQTPVDDACRSNPAPSRRISATSRACIAGHMRVLPQRAYHSGGGSATTKALFVVETEWVGVDGCGGVALSAARSGRLCKTDDPPRPPARGLRVRTPCLPFLVFARCDISARLACVAVLLVYGVVQRTCDWLDKQRELRSDNIKTATMHGGIQPQSTLISFCHPSHPPTRRGYRGCGISSPP